MASKARCQADVWHAGSFRPVQCSRNATMDGYCKTHHPEAMRQKRAELERQVADFIAQCERKNRLREATTELLDALVDATEHDLPASIYRLRERWLNAKHNAENPDNG